MQLLVVKNPPANAGDIRDTSLIPGSGRSLGGWHGSPLRYSCLENPMDREPGGLQSIGSQRVEHYWSDLACMHMSMWLRKRAYFLQLARSPWLSLMCSTQPYLPYVDIGVFDLCFMGKNAFGGSWAAMAAGPCADSHAAVVSAVAMTVAALFPYSQRLRLANGESPQQVLPFELLLHWTTEKDPNQGCPLSAACAEQQGRTCQGSLLSVSCQWLEKNSNSIISPAPVAAGRQEYTMGKNSLFNKWCWQNWRASVKERN